MQQELPIDKMVKIYFYPLIYIDDINLFAKNETELEADIIKQAEMKKKN